MMIAVIHSADKVMPISRWRLNLSAKKPENIPTMSMGDMPKIPIRATCKGDPPRSSTSHMSKIRCIMRELFARRDAAHKRR